MTGASPNNLALRPPKDVASVCVLASGSGGNCTVLNIPQPEHGSRRVILIDAGLSPRRTTKLLFERGIGDWEIDDIILTHLDMDHYHRSWSKARRPTTTLRIHSRHRGRAERLGALYGQRVEPFRDDPQAIRGGVELSSVLLSHDQDGVAALRFALPDGTSLGFATDLGMVSEPLIEHMRGADVIAFESNYCPAMQAASDRPRFLKDRITGGAGHLSNHECLDAMDRIAPAGHVVLLHLSRQCNRPELVASMHAGRGYQFTITDQLRPTGWIPICPALPTRPIITETVVRTATFTESLFSSTPRAQR